MAAGSSALFDIELHGVEDAGLGFINGTPESIYSRKIFAVGPTFPALTLNGDRVGVHFDYQILSRFP
jgi:hypothetical protein